MAGIAGAFYNDSFIDSVAQGRIRVSIPRVIDIDEPFPALAGTFDYLGVNYYTREFVIGHLRGPDHYVPTAPPELPRNDMGWEIYPEGLYRLLMHYRSYGWPLLVTENGIADNGGERARRFHPRAYLCAGPRARRGRRRHRVHLLVADGQLRMVARVPRALRPVLDRLRLRSRR